MRDGEADPVVKVSVWSVSGPGIFASARDVTCRRDFSLDVVRWQKPIATALMANEFCVPGIGVNCQLGLTRVKAVLVRKS